jgi:malate dehydrogenase (oxaloacetate-decarboxylating)(NADP+)
MEHFEELLPIVSIPTVREACQKYGLMFKSLPRGLFVTLEDRGRVFRCSCCLTLLLLNAIDVAA